jgi:hypothetical protein
MPEEGKTGPKGNGPLATFIINLADIYEMATSKEAKSGYYDRAKEEIVGEFPFFVEAVLNKIGNNIYQGPRSLIEKDITQALSRRHHK